MIYVRVTVAVVAKSPELGGGGGLRTDDDVTNTLPNDFRHTQKTTNTADVVDQ